MLPNMSVQVYSSFESLPEPLIAFLDAAAARSFFYSIPWCRMLLRTAGPPADQPRIYAAESGGRPVAVLIVREREAAGRLKTHMLLGPSNGFYASVYGPLLDAELGAAGLREIVAAIARASPRFHVLRFDSLDRHAPEFAALASAFRDARMLVQPLASSDNHYEDVEGRTIEQFLSGRSPQVRDLIDRRTSSLAEAGQGRFDQGRFELSTGGPGFRSALVDYALVDVQSWRGQETYPDCIAETLDVAAGAGVLRLGLFYLDDEPAAAQIWLVGGGQATLWRARYAKKFDIFALATALTIEMLRHAFATDNLREIDCGPGDDKFTEEWLGQRRERAGLLVNLRTVKGLVAAAWHVGGDEAISVARRLLHGLRRLVARLRGR
jgi:hypothetical protein